MVTRLVCGAGIKYMLQSVPDRTMHACRCAFSETNKQHPLMIDDCMCDVVLYIMLNVIMASSLSTSVQVPTCHRSVSGCHGTCDYHYCTCGVLLFLCL